MVALPSEESDEQANEGLLAHAACTAHEGANRYTARPADSTRGSPLSPAPPPRQKVAPGVRPASPLLMAAPVWVQYSESSWERSQPVATASPPATKQGW